MGTTVASIMKDFCDEIDQLFAEVERRLAEVRDNPDQYDMTDVVRFPTLHDDELDYNFRSNENQSSRDDNVCLESNIEDDYDSDCSLGSLNSLYLSLEKKYDRFQDLNNTDGVNRTQLENQNGHGSESTRTPGNDLIATEHIAIDTAMFYNKIKKENPTTELNASDYYGKQKSFAQCRYRKKSSYVHRLRKNNPPKVRKVRTSVQMFKQNVFKLRTIRKMRRKHRKRLVNKNLIRYRLKERIPLLKINRKDFLKNIEEKDVKLRNAVEKLQQNEIDFVTDDGIASIGEEDRRQSVGYTEINNGDELSESDNVCLKDDFIDDFTDDDFEDTKVIDRIYERLFDENDD